MAKNKTVFACQNCGAQSPKWMGRCPECGDWNSLVEEAVLADRFEGKEKGWRPLKVEDTKPVLYEELGHHEVSRLGTGITGLDAVLGGGLVPGSLVLVSGEPGAGKSTLMLQAAAQLADAGKVLYVSGEESEAQVKIRGKRLGIAPKQLYVYNETELDRIIAEFDVMKPGLLIVDSVQTTFSARFSSAPGSVTQVREAAAQLLLVAKNAQVPVLLVGHVNKEGQIAGPKTMEHIVDAVLMLEGDRFQNFRIARCLKNRFGPVSEISVFEMRHEGLIEVENPSKLFLSERASGTSGSAVTATVEGTRPFLIEIQALVSPTAYGAGRRTSEGFDHNRLALLLAIIERRAGIQVSANDVFLNVVGGVRLNEPGVDLAVALAVASSALDKPLPDNTVFIGELGLGGEIRSVPAVELRIKEAAAIGMTDLHLPASNARKTKSPGSLKLHGQKDLSSMIDVLFG